MSTEDDLMQEARRVMQLDLGRRQSPGDSLYPTSARAIEALRDSVRSMLHHLEQTEAATDDEREAGRLAIEGVLKACMLTFATSYEDAAGLAIDKVIAAGFRRTVQGEPPCRYCGRPMSEHPGGVYCPAGPAQGEATDAQVVNRGTFGHIWPCPLFYVGNWKHGDEFYEPVRECTSPAACAVSTVNEGENR